MGILHQIVLNDLCATLIYKYIVTLNTLHSLMLNARVRSAIEYIDLVSHLIHFVSHICECLLLNDNLLTVVLPLLGRISYSFIHFLNYLLQGLNESSLFIEAPLGFGPANLCLLFQH